MKRTILIGFFIFTAGALFFNHNPAEAKTNFSKSYAGFYTTPLAAGEIMVMALGGYSNIIVRTKDHVVLFDPSILMKADLDEIKKYGVNLIIYTHDHGDHYEKGTALKLFDICRAFIAVDPSMASYLKKEIPPDKLIVTASGSSYPAGKIKIDTLKGKHIGPIMLFRVTMDGISVFHGGDSAYVNLSTMASDLAFVPTGYPSPTCKPKYAMKMVADIKPQIAIPMHGGDSQHSKFEKLVAKKLSGIPTIILPLYTPQKLVIH